MPKGFSALPKARRREIASMGGRAAHVDGKGHEFTPEEARVAGAKGGRAIVEAVGVEGMAELGRKGGRSVSQDREHMAAIGRRGGGSHSREHMAKIGRLGAAKRKRQSEGTAQ